MFKLVYLTLLLSTIISCTHQEEKIIIKNAKPKVEKKMVEVTPTKLLTLEVEGMSCEMNCGGSIRKELKKTGAVSRVEFVWVEEAEKQVTKVSYDDTKISEKEIVSLIEKINDGQFTTYGGKIEKLGESKSN
jgi:mercuric ion binding protein